MLVLAAAILLAACQQSPVARPPASKAVSPTERLKAEGDALMAKANYADAVEKYLRAADLDPVAIGPRFGLGSAYSFLEKRPEAIAQFRWVLGFADRFLRKLVMMAGFNDVSAAIVFSPVVVVPPLVWLLPWT